MAWFSKIAFYIRIADDHVPDLNERLAKKLFQRVGGLEWFSEGFVPPAKHLEDDQLVYSFRDCRSFKIRRESKDLKPRVIKGKLDEKVEDIEAKELRKVGRKEKIALKDQIADDLLPHAFVLDSFTEGYIDDRRGFVVINAAPGNAENALTAIREVAPPFPAALPRTKIAPHTAMTDWLLNGEAPEGFEFDSDCTLADGSENGATVRCTRMDLTCNEVRNHVATGKHVTSISLIWREKIKFSLSDQLALNKVKFLDVLQEEASQAGDDLASLHEATMTLMVEEVGELLEALLLAFGGLEDCQQVGEQGSMPINVQPAVAAKEMVAEPWD